MPRRIKHPVQPTRAALDHEDQSWARKKVVDFLKRQHVYAQWSPADIDALVMRTGLKEGLTCGYCNDRLTRDNLNFDHVCPVSRGGPTLPDNIRPMHGSCNRAKGAMNGAEWSELVAVLRSMPPAVRLSVIRRLRAGWRAGRLNEA